MATCAIPSGWQIVGVSPVTTARGAEKYCAGLGAVTGVSLSQRGCGRQDSTCFRQVGAPAVVPIIYPVEELMGLNPETMRAIELGVPIINGVPVSEPIPTLDIVPLISEGVAQKLLDAGFSEETVLPLTKVTTAEQKVSEVNDFMEEARDRGITPPRDILPETLIVTSVAPDVITTPPVSRGLGIALMLLLGLVMLK